MSDELLRHEEVAKLLNWSSGKLHKYRQWGQGPKFIRVERNYVRYRRRDVEEFMRQQEECGK